MIRVMIVSLHFFIIYSTNKNYFVFFTFFVDYYFVVFFSLNARPDIIGMKISLHKNKCFKETIKDRVRKSHS